MLNSKQRAELRAQSNDLDTTLMVGKGGVTEAVIAEAENQLTARELVKGKVLEGALMSPREVSDAICEATGAEGVACVGSKFVIYRFSEKKQAERNMTGRASGRKPLSASPTLCARAFVPAAMRPSSSGSSAMPSLRRRLWSGPLSGTGKSSCGRRKGTDFGFLRNMRDSWKGREKWKKSAFLEVLSIRPISGTFKAPHMRLTVWG